MENSVNIFCVQTGHFCAQLEMCALSIRTVHMIRANIFCKKTQRPLPKAATIHKQQWISFTCSRPLAANVIRVVEALLNFAAFSYMVEHIPPLCNRGSVASHQMLV